MEGRDINMTKMRKAAVERNTNETKINVEMNVDGEGNAKLETGIPFFTHMLDIFTMHGQFNLKVQADGDIEVDFHHTVEDIAICLGQAFGKALGDKYGIKRYGNVTLPLDESLVQVVVDLGNRPHFEFHGEFPAQKVGNFDVELVHEFLSKFACEARMNLHVIIHSGRNTHHMIESIFKALGRALDEAALNDSRIKGVPSTKGLL